MTRCASSSRAWPIHSRIFAALPVMSPTTAFIWASAIRIGSVRMVMPRTVPGSASSQVPFRGRRLLVLLAAELSGSLGDVEEQGVRIQEVLVVERPGDAVRGGARQRADEDRLAEAVLVLRRERVLAARLRAVRQPDADGV